MPTAPLRPCTTPGCPELTNRSRCPTHRLQVERTYDRRRGTAHQRGYDRRWQKYRAWYLAHHPWCQHPGCGVMATDVDHVDGLGPKGPRGYDPANCRGLCHPHHSERTARDQPGGFNKR